MRFRAVRPSQLGKVDAIVVTLFAGGEPPAWLPRTTKTAIARLQKHEQGVTRLDVVNFIAQSTSGQTLAQKAVTIYVAKTTKNSTNAISILKSKVRMPVLRYPKALIANDPATPAAFSAAQK